MAQPSNVMLTEPVPLPPASRAAPSMRWKEASVRVTLTKVAATAVALRVLPSAAAQLWPPGSASGTAPTHSMMAVVPAQVGHGRLGRKPVSVPAAAGAAAPAGGGGRNSINRLWQRQLGGSPMVSTVHPSAARAAGSRQRQSANKALRAKGEPRIMGVVL